MALRGDSPIIHLTSTLNHRTWLIYHSLLGLLFDHLVTTLKYNFPKSQFVHQSHCELTVVTSILMMHEALAWLHFPKQIIKHFKKARNQKNKSIHMRNVKYHFVSSVCYNDPALSPDVLKH